jgi:sugar lactone lactonase YvrE
MSSTSFESLFESIEPKQVATGFVFTEGPLWDPSGFMYVSDVDARIHYRVDLSTGDKHVIRTDSGGANGAVFDKQGRVVICEQDARRVRRYEADGSLTLLASHYEGKRLNRSNDIVRGPHDTFYFTDPDKKALPEHEKELHHAAIWRLHEDGKLDLLASDMNHPNGLAFSPDGKTLYVSNSRPDPHLHAYDVATDGSLSNSRIVDQMPYGPAGELDGVPDGLKLDEKGNIFSPGPGGIWIWNSKEELLGVLKLPELPANLGWGDADRRTMLVTARTSVYSLRVKTAGIPVQP